MYESAHDEVVLTCGRLTADLAGGDPSVRTVDPDGERPNQDLTAVQNRIVFLDDADRQIVREQRDSLHRYKCCDIETGNRTFPVKCECILVSMR